MRTSLISTRMYVKLRSKINICKSSCSKKKYIILRSKFGLLRKIKYDISKSATEYCKLATLSSPCPALLHLGAFKLHHSAKSSWPVDQGR